MITIGEQRYKLLLSPTTDYYKDSCDYCALTKTCRINSEPWKRCNNKQKSNSGQYHYVKYGTVGSNYYSINWQHYH